MARIILIESDKYLAKNLAGYAKTRSHSLNWHISLQSALDDIDQNQPDAIILDLMLAGQSGLEFIYEFKSYPEWQKIPLIIYSSLPIEEAKTRLGSYEHLNIASFLYKPSAGLAQLFEAVENSLQPASV